MNFAIDYNADTLKIKGSPSEETLTKTAPGEGLERVIVRNEIELGALDPALLLRIANFKTKGGQLTELPGISEIWALLSPPPKPPKAKKNLQNPPNQDLTDSAKSPTSGSSEGVAPDPKKPEAGASKTTKEAKVAKAKKTAKKTKGKNGAAKSANGLPREGTKAAKLLALISRPGGATFAEMKAATGWKEMRGTALTLAARAGKKLTSVKADGKATRWVAK